MLDDTQRISGIDAKNMLETIRRMPEHLLEGVRLGRAAGPSQRAPSEIVVCGLGGSAIGGDMLCSWLETNGGPRCEVVRGYGAPGWLDSDTLAIVASYSGNTEETLALLEDVIKRGPRVVILTSGGILAEKADGDGIPCVTLPPGMVPRASFGYMFGAMLGIVGAACNVDVSSQVRDAISAMEMVNAECGMSMGTVNNAAKKLAHEIQGFVPVVIGHGMSVPVAKRWANQLNENAKSVAFSSQLPEMDHNEIVFWSSDPRSKGFMGVLLDHSHSDERMRRRIEATKQIMLRNSRVSHVNATGESCLSQMLSLVMMGDYVSLYCAVLRGQDPSTTEPIESLKAMIAKK